MITRTVIATLGGGHVDNRLRGIDSTHTIRSTVHGGVPEGAVQKSLWAGMCEPGRYLAWTSWTVLSTQDDVHLRHPAMLATRTFRGTRLSAVAVSRQRDLRALACVPPGL
jgi:hypothetical protein